MAIGVSHDETETHQHEYGYGKVIPASEAKRIRTVPPVDNGGDIQPYPYGTMKARPYNF